MRRVWITSKTLRGAWAEADPVPGEHVTVVFQGMRTTRDGRREYPIFEVEIASRGW